MPPASTAVTAVAAVARSTRTRLTDPTSNKATIAEVPRCIHVRQRLVHTPMAGSPRRCVDPCLRGAVVCHDRRQPKPLRVAAPGLSGVDCVLVPRLLLPHPDATQ